MLYQLVQLAQDWVREHFSAQADKGTTTPPPIKDSYTPSKQTTSSQKICHFFLRGKCKFGAKCHNLHSKSAPKMQSSANGSLHSEMMARQPAQQTSSDTAEGDEDSVVLSEQDAQESAKVTGSAGGKKPSMKTATNVIHRILWDEQLPSKHFTVGYLDRFLGILEKPFKAFSWEDLSTVGYDVLAIPKHRIQYFKYKGVIVWDKRSQFDNVFGSRGTGKTILDIIAELGGEDKVAVEGTHEGNEGSSDSDFDPEDNDEVRIPSKMGIYKAKIDKNRPTHFIYIPVCQSKDIVSKVKELQDHITERDPRFVDGKLPLDNLHVSVGYVRLETESDCQKATSVLNSLQPHFASILPSNIDLHVKGVDTFRDQLIFAKVDNFPALIKFVHLLLQRFEAAGIPTPGNHSPYVPHVTLLRLRRGMMREMNQSVIESWLYQPFKDATFGNQAIQALCIGEMADFYVRYRHSITNSPLTISPQVLPLVCTTVDCLASNGMCPADTAEEVKSAILSFQNGDLSKSSKAVEYVHKLIMKSFSGKRKKFPVDSLPFTLDTPIVVVLRGLPGSGKSWIVSNCAEMRTPDKMAVCSADKYFTNVETESYEFSSDLLPLAHQQCLAQFVHAIAEHKPLVVIDNTNVQEWEYRIYKYLSTLFGLRCYLLEVPCLSEEMVHLYAVRNQHNVTFEAELRMFKNWEKDDSAILVPPSVANPYHNSVPYSFSLREICCQDQLLFQLVKDRGYSVSIVFSGLFLLPEYRWNLLSAVKPLHPTVYTEHITLVYKPTLAQIGGLMLGQQLDIVPIGWASDQRVQAVEVEKPSGFTLTNRHTHITISTERGVSPKYSNDLLLSRPQLQNVPESAMPLKGRVGLLLTLTQLGEVDDQLKDSTFHIFDESKLQAILPYIQDNPASSNVQGTSINPAPCSAPEILFQQSGASILPGLQKITKLFVFDFDGTLFHTPGPADGRMEYEKLTGKKWPHERGWLIWPESLLPPFRIHPGPALQYFHTHCGQADALTVVITGRIQKLEDTVTKVLHNHNIFPDKCFFKDTPIQKESTSSYKVRIVQELLTQNPSIDCIKVFDDLDDVLLAFSDLAVSLARNGVAVDIVDSKILELPRDDEARGAVEALLKQTGLLPSQSHGLAATAGINLIASLWSQCVHFAGPPTHLVLQFGSHPLGRSSDVDLCLLAPPFVSHFECIDLLSRQMQAAGSVYIHKGYSSRCPKLKVMLQFKDQPSINYDVIFYIVSNEEYFKNDLLKTTPNISTLKSLLKAGDSISKTALTGPIFLHHVLNKIEKHIAIQEFGMAVEMVVWYLRVSRQKGNGCSCIRTFHIVQILADLVPRMSEERLQVNPPSTVSKTDNLFSLFIVRTSTLDKHKWLQLFNDRVPASYIAPLQESLDRARAVLAAYDDVVSREFLYSLLEPSLYPPQGYVGVCISYNSQEKKLAWELDSFLEGRVSAYIYKIISKGVSVLPGGNGNPGSICFAVKDETSSTDAVHDVLKSLWTELAHYRKHPSVHFQLIIGSSPTSLDCIRGTLLTGISDYNIVEQIMTFATSVKLQSKEPGVLRLPSSLTSYERMLVHDCAERLGLDHLSSGDGKNRHVILKHK